MPVACVPRPDGAIRLDGTQNISGFVRLRVRGNPGDEVVVRHAEVLEPDGSLHTRSLRSARAEDHYTLADAGETVLEPAFTFHGFQFAEVRTAAELLEAELVAISSDIPRRATFECADPRLNQLHQNVVWSQRDNFVSVPTDCPQRDERLGWTGDAQAFAPTASTLFDSQSFWASWLRDLALEQHDELGVPSVVPDVVLAGEPGMGARAGRTRPRSFPGRSTSRTATWRSCERSCRA
jgi:alpha-L-rhamnosidase